MHGKGLTIADVQWGLAKLTKHDQAPVLRVRSSVAVHIVDDAEAAAGAADLNLEAIDVRPA